MLCDFNRRKRTYNSTRLLAICFGCGLVTSILSFVRDKESFELYFNPLFLNLELIMSGKKADLNEKQIFVRNLPFDVTAEVNYAVLSIAYLQLQMSNLLSCL